jgi:hypothetical protein
MSRSRAERANRAKRAERANRVNRTRRETKQKNGLRFLCNGLTIENGLMKRRWIVSDKCNVFRIYISLFKFPIDSLFLHSLAALAKLEKFEKCP